MAQKIMWNNYYRWRSDQFYYPKPGWIAYRQRKGGRLQSVGGNHFYIYFIGRTALDPKPALTNPNGLFFAYIHHTYDPPTKDMDMLIWRYNDTSRSDDMWTYIPTLRRTIRMISSERANPVRGSPVTLDDFYTFDGKINEFNYKFLQEKQCLALMNQVTMAEGKYYKGFDHPIIDTDPWEMWKHYVIEITPKDPSYPESKRILWVTDKIFFGTAAETYDRKGDFWKGCWASYAPKPTAQGETGPWMTGTSYTDFKTDYWMGTMLRVDPCANCPVDPNILNPGYLGTPLPTH